MANDLKAPSPMGTLVAYYLGVIVVGMACAVALDAQVGRSKARAETKVYQTQVGQMREALTEITNASRECRLSRQSDHAAMATVLEGLGISPEVMRLRWEVMNAGSRP